MTIDAIEKIITDEYLKGNNNLGWRLLNTKGRRLIENNGVFIISLNPGTGKGNYINHDYLFSNENGNSLLHEEWKSPIKKQLLLLLNGLYDNDNEKSTFNDYVENIVQGYFIPFRSKSINEFEVNESVINLSMEIWKCIIYQNIDKIRNLNCIGKDLPYKYVIKIIEEIGGEIISKGEYSTGWGKIAVVLSKYRMKNGRNISIVGYPHLSQFKLFGRDSSKDMMDKIVKDSIITN